jgi:arsenate reductase
MASINKIKVLFVCVHNSARSQMAEAFLNQMAGDKFAAESAGLEPGVLNPVVVEAMREVGIDISKNPVKGVFDFIKAGRTFNYIISVCDEAAGERCPIFPGLAHRISWSFPDPSKFTGSPEEKLSQVRGVREQIQKQLQEFIQTYSQTSF